MSMCGGRWCGESCCGKLVTVQLCVCVYFPQLVVVNVGVHVFGYFVDTPRPKGLPVTYFLAG